MMNRMKLSLFIPKTEIEVYLERLAYEINRDFKDRPLVVIGVLKGSFVFMADLIRRLNMPVELDFVGLASYGKNTQSCGKVHLTRPLNRDITEKDILVIEDIVDSGLTVSYLLKYLKKRRTNSVKLCALLSKPSRRVCPVEIDYLGCEVEDKFLVGYGLDWAECYRQLPEIFALEGKPDADKP
ncbi:hypoxanthine phosphoribosyltransferase [Dehalococcoides mccartyi]|uniref:hypoxanthine phosphoribosyltransferase n=1 Tax=Dehalococcoides mccartyi TaxID=61435 RepID=UPI0002B768AB|nr:hypoxanthine phosphoribosyltransferase [Dehalococcoides mccartyi]AGG07810.1 hypoxanthine-guanine phosphoribosyltransferase [Dehalococcoides mccartyi BTF08]KSV17010.1 hypoxanthine phosphoribosyltransferase [Dehalococcoides mccartyi]